MTTTDTSNLKGLLENIRAMSLWDRLFGWKRIEDGLMAAVADLERLQAQNSLLQDKTSARAHQIDLPDQKNGQLAVSRNQLVEANAQLRVEDEKRRQEINKQLATLGQYQDRILAEREAEKALAHQKEWDRLERQKLTWSDEV